MAPILYQVYNQCQAPGQSDYKPDIAQLSGHDIAS